MGSSCTVPKVGLSMPLADIGVRLCLCLVPPPQTPLRVNWRLQGQTLADIVFSTF